MKRIGILCQQTSSQSKTWMYGVYKNYVKLFEPYGKIIPIMPDMGPEDVNLDLLVLPGGPDVSAALTIGATGRFKVGQGRDEPCFTAFFETNLEQFIQAGVPIFGICLGMQALNVHFGGGLWPDMFGHATTSVSERVLVLPDEETNLEMHIARVNSRHHQAIRHDAHYNQLSDYLVPLVVGATFSDELKCPKNASTAGHERRMHQYYKEVMNGDTSINKQRFSCVEAFRHESRKIAGVQWHPEDLIYGNYDHGDYVAHQLIAWLLDGEAVEVNAPQAPIPSVADEAETALSR